MYQALSPDCIGHAVPFSRAAAVIAKYGFEGVWFELTHEDTADAEPVLELLARYRLRAAGFGLPVDFRRDGAVFEADLKNLEKYARYAGKIGIDRCITWMLPGSDTLTYAENFKLHRERLGEAAKVLKEYGIRLGLEFVGTPSMRRQFRYEFIHDLDQTLELCDAVGTGNVGLLMDAWHWQMAGQTQEDFKKIPDESWVVLAHIMDAPAGLTVGQQQDTVRRLPGSTGVLKIADFFRGLRDLAYTGPVVPEPFEQKLGEMPFEEAVKMTKEAVDRVWPQ
jgi:sugar phosphate isomerase/epimerase